MPANTINILNQDARIVKNLRVEPILPITNTLTVDNSIQKGLSL